jgi:hypothetical protein
MADDGYEAIEPSHHDMLPLDPPPSDGADSAATAQDPGHSMCCTDSLRARASDYCEPVATTQDAPSQPVADPPLSKKAQRRLRRQEKWAQIKQQLKEEKKRKRKEAKALGSESGDERASKHPHILSTDEDTLTGEKATVDESANTHDDSTVPSASRRKERDAKVCLLARAISSAPTSTLQALEFDRQCDAGPWVVVDCAWEDEMSDKELRSLSQQIMFCYACNRKAPKPFKVG